MPGMQTCHLTVASSYPITSYLQVARGSRVSRPQRVALLLGLVVTGLSALIAGFIAVISRGVGPSDQVARAACIGALLGSAGVIAVLGARQGRPALVAAAGLISIGTSILSIVTLGFAVLGLALVVSAGALGA